MSPCVPPDHDEYSYEHGADWVSHHPAPGLDKDGRDYHTHAAQSVGQDVQENACSHTSHACHVVGVVANKLRKFNEVFIVQFPALLHDIILNN